MMTGQSFEVGSVTSVSIWSCRSKRSSTSVALATTPMRLRSESSNLLVARSSVLDYVEGNGQPLSYYAHQFALPREFLTRLNLYLIDSGLLERYLVSDGAGFDRSLRQPRR